MSDLATILPRKTATPTAGWRLPAWPVALLLPATGLLLWALAEREAWLPPGILPVVAGGDEVDRALTEPPGVSRISFTGAVATCKAVMASAAGTCSGWPPS